MIAALKVVAVAWGVPFAVIVGWWLASAALDRWQLHRRQAEARFADSVEAWLIGEGLRKW